MFLSKALDDSIRRSSMHFSGFIEDDDILTLVATRGAFLPIEGISSFHSDLENDTGNKSTTSLSNIENSSFPRTRVVAE